MASKTPNRKPKRTDATGTTNGSITGASEERRREKKREQNRISQRCCRERQASYVKQLERFVEGIQASTAGSSDTQRQLRQLQIKHLDLLKENRDLREALLRMRKKLLSLSMAVTACADDPTSTIDQVRGTIESFQGASGIPTPGTDVRDGFIQNFPPQPRFPGVGDPAATPDPTPAPSFMCGEMHVNSEPPAMPVAPLPSTALSPTSPLALRLGSFTPLSYDPPMAAAAGAPVIQSIDRSMIPLSPMRMVGPPMQADSLGPGSPLFADLALSYSSSLRDYIKRFSKPDYHDNLVQVVERAAREVLAKMQFSLLNESWGEVGLPSRVFSSRQVARIDSMTLLDVCKMASRLMLKCSILEQYPYIMGTAPAVEKILRWRIQPTPENRAAIPEPFRPTSLQQFVPERPPSLDMIHFGELRDQLIIYMGAYDMRTVHRDSIEALVREVPSLGIALPILEFYHYLVEKSSPSGSIEICEDSEESETVDAEYSPDAPYRPCPNTTIQLAKRYGLHRLHERKLHPDFAGKYPFLDVKSITTNYPIVGSRDIGRYEYLLFRDPSINA